MYNKDERIANNGANTIISLGGDENTARPDHRRIPISVKMGLDGMGVRFPHGGSVYKIPDDAGVFVWEYNL